MSKKVIISCEHAGNEVPEQYRHLFEEGTETLETHRGIDIGALELTNTIADRLEKEPYLHTVTRLLVDLNRSVQNPTLFSEFTRKQPLNIRENIFKEYYQPHRQQVEQKIKEVVAGGDQALHIGVHTFTPVWDSMKREVDVGFLFDPTRPEEQEFCRLWREELDKSYPGLRLKMNRPYRGTMDGFTTYLRRTYSGGEYAGMELEVNQRFTAPALKTEWTELQDALADSLQGTLKKLS